VNNDKVPVEGKTRTYEAAKTAAEGQSSQPDLCSIIAVSPHIYIISIIRNKPNEKPYKKISFPTDSNSAYSFPPFPWNDFSIIKTKQYVFYIHNTLLSLSKFRSNLERLDPIAMF